jgi:hypothetical protein
LSTPGTACSASTRSITAWRSADSQITTLPGSAPQREIEIVVRSDHRGERVRGRVAVLDDEAGDMDVGIGTLAVHAMASVARA